MVESDPPSDEDVISAEDALLAHYKGDLPESENPEEMRLSDEEQAVVDAVRDGNPTGEEVGGIIGHEPEDDEEEIVEEEEIPDEGTEAAEAENLLLVQDQG